MNLINRLLVLLVSILSFSVLTATKDQITIAAYDAIYENTLTSIEGPCLSFDINSSSDDFYLVAVRENHTNPECGGDSNVSVKIFDIRINKSNGSIYTNQGDDPDNFRELRANSKRCTIINNEAEDKQSKIPPSESGHVVSDTNRVYFYSAPNETCKIKNLFIINGDKVNIYAEYKFFSLISFKKKGQLVSGWIHSKSIKPTGTGVETASK